MAKLETFIDETLEFTKCKSFKDTLKNEDNLYEIIIEELKMLLHGVSDAGEGNQHHVIVIAFFGHGGKF
jgi:hypothetical protein